MSEPSQAPTPRRPKLWWTIVKVVVIPLIVVGVIVFAVVKKGDDRAEILENGVTAVAVPTGGTVAESDRNNGQKRTVRYVRLEFRYIVEGTTYTAAGDQRYKRNFFDKYDAIAANPQAEVRYLKDDPSRAIVLDKDYR